MSGLKARRDNVTRLNISEFPAPDSLPDIARRLHGLADELGVEECTVCFVLMRAARPRLLIVLDTKYPRVSDRTRALPDLLDDTTLHHIATHTAPFAWTGGPEAGLGFPVFSESGQRGVFFFTGGQPDAAGDLLWDAHCRCLQYFSTIVQLRPGTATPSPSISKREIECLKLTANGHTSEEIAQLLGLSVHTANQYLASTAQKLNATNRIHAVSKALRLGLIN